MEDDTDPWLIELLRHVEKLATKTADHERKAAIFGSLTTVQGMASDALAGPLREKREPTKTERQALIAAAKALRNAEIAGHALDDVHHDGEPAMGAAEVCIILAAYQAGYAQAMADQADTRRHCARARSASTKRKVQSVAEEIEQAARSVGSAAGLAEKLAPKVNRSTGYLERSIRAARRRLKSGCE